MLRLLNITLDGGKKLPYKDLREFLKELEKRGEFTNLKKEVEDGFEVFNIIWRLNDLQGPAFMAKIKGYDTPLVSNILGTLDRWALACGFPLGKTQFEYRDLFSQKVAAEKEWAEPELVSAAPCKDVILKGDEVNLTKFPILKWHPKDGGAFITLPIAVTRDDRFGKNAGIYRMMVLDKNKTTIMCVQLQDIGIHIGRAMAKKKETIPCSIAIGVDPSIVVAAATKLRLGQNEIAFASSLRGGEPVEVVKCETNDLEVPATSEIVLEGEISVTEREREGPLSEFTGYFEEPVVVNTFKVNCITHRKDPIYVMTVEGHRHSEGESVRLVPQMASFHEQCKGRISAFSNSYLPPSGRGCLAVISIRKRLPGWGKQAIFQAASIPYVAAAVNVIVVVDDDINPADVEQVMWSISTRVDPEKDVLILPPVGGIPSNPAAPVRPDVYASTGATDVSLCSKVGIDATLKMGPEEGRQRPSVIPVYPVNELMEKVKAQWKEYGFS